jgi:hypothetical protein
MLLEGEIAGVKAALPPLELNATGIQLNVNRLPNFGAAIPMTIPRPRAL